MNHYIGEVQSVNTLRRCQEATTEGRSKTDQIGDPNNQKINENKDQICILSSEYTDIEECLKFLENIL